MGLVPRSPKSLQTLENFASRSTIHGVSYVFDHTISLVDRLLWMIICLTSVFLATYLTHSSYTEWQDNQVVTTLKTAAKPLTGLHFPAFTICGAGQHMGNVEKVLFHNFKKWEEEQTTIDKEQPLEDTFADYMKQTFQIYDKGTSIIDILNTMISPSEEASGANAIRNNEQACATKKRNIVEESTG